MLKVKWRANKRIKLASDKLSRRARVSLQKNKKFVLISSHVGAGQDVWIERIATYFLLDPVANVHFRSTSGCLQICRPTNFWTIRKEKRKQRCLWSCLHCESSTTKSCKKKMMMTNSFGMRRMSLGYKTNEWKEKV